MKGIVYLVMAICLIGTISAGSIIYEEDAIEYSNADELSIDGDWNTCNAYIHDDENKFMYLNYSIPRSAKGALWIIKLEDAFTKTIEVKIPKSCLRYKSNKLILLIDSDMTTPTDYYNLYCYDKRGWKLFYSDVADAGDWLIYEEAVAWWVNNKNKV